MKKIIAVLLILLCVFPALALADPTPSNIYKQGVYTPDDLKNFAINTNTYNVQNVSTDKNAYIVIFDKNFLAVQALYLSPNSQKYNLIPFKADYRIVIVGDGDVYIS
ncbi:hypothetical protein [Clostridium beijerinckii]|nr:hypothetical protein [Clostridium beijerinckii]MBA8937286.1 hypothetical protein [Clostridium beijerinckii]MBF7811555.1 hypothetical protein [Clostridium beijerinckii]MBF7812268.1 hypothetical protein [Clostridium beijerinckii]NRT24870.1 hypothetical protein [Clostridium beijerinckii]NRT34063.1 hypothetical protein [Clostridium beijerinckii]